MILRRGERLLFQGPASAAHGESRISGALFLTNYRIVFEAGAGGPSPYTAYAEELDKVWNVHSGATSRFLEGRREFLTVEGERGRIVFDVVGAPAWANALVHAKSSLPTPPPLPPPPPPSVPPSPTPFGLGAPAPIVVNIPAPTAPRIMMHCRHCGNLFDATLGRCERCGAPPA